MSDDRVERMFAKSVCSAEEHRLLHFGVIMHVSMSKHAMQFDDRMSSIA